MLKRIRLRPAGGSVSVRRPKEMTDRLSFRAGDEVLAVETDNGILLTAHDAATLEAYRRGSQIAKRFRHVLRQLD